jgi:hypothetical protein
MRRIAVRPLRVIRRGLTCREGAVAGPLGAIAARAVRVLGLTRVPPASSHRAAGFAATSIRGDCRFESALAYAANGVRPLRVIRWGPDLSQRCGCWATGAAACFAKSCPASAKCSVRGKARSGDARAGGESPCDHCASSAGPDMSRRCGCWGTGAAGCFAKSRPASRKCSRRRDGRYVKTLRSRMRRIAVRPTASHIGWRPHVSPSALAGHRARSEPRGVPSAAAVGLRHVRSDFDERRAHSAARISLTASAKT